MIVQPPSISYKAFPSWEVHFVRVYDDGTLSGVDMSAGVSYNAAVDLDFNINTEPLIRTLDADIDHSQAASGIISLGLNAGTEGFLSAVNGRNSVQGWFELRGYDTTDRCIYDYRIKCNCLGAIDPNSGDPIPVASGGITQADVLALLRASLEYQFSSDETNWHPIQEPTDDYYRTRYPQGEWGEAISIQNGQDAPALQIKYSDDNSSWSSYGPTPTSSSFYMAQSVDGGSSWISGILFHGQDGINGTNGVGFRTVGAYNDATIYHPYTTSGYYEVVAYDGSTYAYINDTASSGHTPPTATLIDSYWQCIAKKGASGSADNVHAEDVIGLTEFIDDTVSGNYVTSSELTNAVDDLSAAIDYNLLSYATTDSVYNRESVDSKLSLKANSSDVYTKAATDNTFSTKTDLSTVSGILQNEIDNIPAPADLSAYTPLSTAQTISGSLQSDIDTVSGNLNSYALTSTVQTISGTLQNEISTLSTTVENLPSSAIEGVNLNNERTLTVSNVAWVLAMPMRTTMPNANDTEQDFMFYVGETNATYTKAHLYEKKADESATPPEDDDLFITIPDFNIDNVQLEKTNGYWYGEYQYGTSIKVYTKEDSITHCEKRYVIEIGGSDVIMSDNNVSDELPWDVYPWVLILNGNATQVTMTHVPHGGSGARTYHWTDISPWASNS